MIFTVSSAFLAVFTIYYIYFVLRIRFGLLALQNAGPSLHFPFVSIIVAARNEEEHIVKLLNSLTDQSYPVNNYEIIVVNDASEDNTGLAVKHFAEEHKNIRLFSIDRNEHSAHLNKTFALSNGIKHANGDVIMTTDADCIVRKRWIEIMVSHLKDDVVFVAGPVAENISNNILSKLENLEFLGLITSAAGLIGSGYPVICNGANLAYLKSAFEKAGGFGDNTVANDDEYLMNRMVHNQIGKVAFAPEADALVNTFSNNTVSSFLHQRIRWANKRQHYNDKSILLSLVLLYLFFLTLFLSFLLSFSDSKLLLPFLTAFSCKAAADYITLNAGSKMFRQYISFPYFIIAEILHVPYIVFAAFAGQFVSIIWKERRI